MLLVKMHERFAVMPSEKLILIKVLKAAEETDLT